MAEFLGPTWSRQEPLYDAANGRTGNVTHTLHQ